MAARTKEPSFSLYASVYHAADELGMRARDKYLRALADFYFLGKEPTDLPRDARLVFNGVRRRIERARDMRQVADGSCITTD